MMTMTDQQMTDALATADSNGSGEIADWFEEEIRRLNQDEA